MKKILILILYISILVFVVDFRSYAKNVNSYVVYDCDYKCVLKGNNIHQKALIASTTKIMTAICAIENMEILGEIEITLEDVNIEGSKAYVVNGDKYTLYDLLHGLLLRSGNDCANAIARSYSKGYDEFIKLMNNKCKELNMKDSSFENPSGLDGVNENKSTSYDMALLMDYCIRNDMFLNISSKLEYKAKSSNGYVHIFKNKDKLLNREEFICGKTGYTKKSGRVLINYAKAYSRNIIIVTINDPNDWANHVGYLNELPHYSYKYELKRGIYNVNNYSFKIELLEDISIHINKDKLKDYNYVIDITQEMINIYYKDTFISKHKIRVINDED